MAGSVSTLGAGSNMDLQGIIDKLKAADQVPITNIKAQQLQYKDQLAEFETVNTKLLAVKNNALDLSLDTTFLARQVTSSQSSVLTATVSSGASVGTSTVHVGRLAKQNSWKSTDLTGVAKADAVVGAGIGSFAYTVNGKTSSVVVSAATTLQQLSDAINNDTNNPGVTASVRDDGLGTLTSFSLVLVSKETGDANAVTIGTNNTTLVMEQVQAKGVLDAQVTINSLDYQRASNTISDILSGVTLNLESAPGDSTIKITSDTGSVKDKIVAMVDAYNAAMKEIADNSKYDSETKVAGSLSGISTFRTMTSQMNQTLLTSINGLGGAYSNMTDIGLSFNRDGTASLDQTVLGAALESNPEDVQRLLVGDTAKGIDGVATQLNAQLRDITKPSRGVISNEKDRVDQTIQRLNDQIETMTTRLNSKYDLLTKQFVQLDTLLSSFQKQGDFLTAQIASLTASKN